MNIEFNFSGLKKLREYLNHIVHTLGRIETHMATKTDVVAAIATLESSVSALVAEQAAAFARLALLITGGSSSEDLQAEVDRLITLNSQLQSALAAAQATGQPPVAPSPAPTEPPPVAPPTEG